MRCQGVFVSDLHCSDSMLPAADPGVALAMLVLAHEIATTSLLQKSKRCTGCLGGLPCRGTMGAGAPEGGRG